MKIVELINHLQLPISNEENDLLSKFSDGEKLSKSSLNEREQFLVSQLVNKGVVIRKNNNGIIEYFRNINH
jgi:hypothetical protein